MNKIEIGSKVVHIRCGDEGVVTGIFPDLVGETAWWVLWETGDFAGKELWLNESHLILLSEYNADEYPQHNLPVGE